MCDKFLNTGLLYFYGELTTQEKNIFENHLKECKSCREELEKLKEVSQSYCKLPLEEPSQELIHNVLAAATREEKTQNKNISITLYYLLKNIRIRWSIGAAIGSTLLILITSHLLYQPKTEFEWSNGLDERISNLSENVRAFDYSSEFDDMFSTNIDTKIETLSATIENFETK